MYRDEKEMVRAACGSSFHFDSEIENPEKVERLYQLSKNMTDDDLDILIATAERLNKKWKAKTKAYLA